MQMIWQLRLNNFKRILPALFVPLIFFGVQGDIGLDLWDEGFFWYGAQRITFGEVPVRDFMAYDIGRYYWSGAFLRWFGDLGIISVRYSVVVLQAITLFISLTAIQKDKQENGFVFNLFAAVILLFWMYPYFKSFDHLAAVMILGGLTIALATQSSRGFFICGLAIGLSALLGRNHGLYGAVAASLMLGYTTIASRDCKHVAKLALFLCFGVVVGYLPMILMLLFVEGFAEAYWINAIKFLFENNTTNIPLPIPWLWHIQAQTMQWEQLIPAIGIGIFFLLMPCLLVFGIFGAFFKNRFFVLRIPVVLGGVFASLPYMHYAYSRPDLVHLSVSMIPLLIGLLGLMVRLPRRSSGAALITLLLLTVSVLLPVQMGYVALRGGEWEKTKVGKDELLLDTGTILQLRMVKDLVSRFAPDGRTFLAVPFMPGAYPVFERKAPIWEIYGLFSRGKEFQELEINRIEKAKPGFAIVWDFPLDGRDELRFKNTHPLIQKHIEENFDIYLDPNASKEFYLFKSRGNASAE